MKRYNIRLAGVGGQGVVTSAHIIGNAMSNSGKYASLVPFFGSEKGWLQLKLMLEHQISLYMK